MGPTELLLLHQPGVQLRKSPQMAVYFISEIILYFLVHNFTAKLIKNQRFIINCTFSYIIRPHFFLLSKHLKKLRMPY